MVEGNIQMTVGTYSNFLAALGQNESGNNYGFVSSLGYLGRFQFGEEALKAVGFYQGDDGTGAIDFIGSWTPKAAAFGVWDKATFLQSPAAQDAAAQGWFAEINANVNALGLHAYDDKWVNGIHVTPSGLLAGAHLVGVWALKAFLESGGQTDTRDGYGTPVSEYVHRFGDFETPFSSPTTPTLSSGVNDALVGGDAADTLRGFSGDDTLEGRAGGDALFGGDGADSLSGGAGDDYQRGEDGDDRLQGGDGADDINGNMGDDTAAGGAGGDVVVGGKDNDSLAGDGGADIVWGNLGNDTIEGGDGDDQVRGGQGDDIVSGGSGDDFVSGDRGADTVSGGPGADLFHAFRDAGLDRVLDFNPGEGDRVMLDAGTAYSLSQVGGDTVIDMGDAQMVLVNVPLASLHPGWIFEG